MRIEFSRGSLAHATDAAKTPRIWLFGKNAETGQPVSITPHHNGFHFYHVLTWIGDEDEGRTIPVIAPGGEGFTDPLRITPSSLAGIPEIWKDAPPYKGIPGLVELHEATVPSDIVQDWYREFKS